MNFNTAFELVIGHEGEYVNNPKDKGGETKFGISKRSYPAEDIPNITLERAKEIYYKDYWGPAGCDSLPGMLRFHIFDFAANSNPGRAVKTLQKLVGEVQDGSVGPRTLLAVANWDLRKLGILYNLERGEYLTSLKQSEFMGGWANRIFANIRLLLGPKGE